MGVNIPHLLITLVGFYFLYLLCKKYFKTMGGFFITFSIVAFNLELVENLVMIRVYAVLPTLALMSLYFAQMLVGQYAQLSPRQRIGIASFFVVLIWFHVYGIVILGCTMLFAILEKWREPDVQRVLKDILRLLTVVFVVAMPLWCYSVFGPHLSYEQETFVHRKINTFDYIPNPLVTILGFLKSIFGNLIGYKGLYFLLFGMLIPVFLPYRRRLRDIAFFLILVVLPIQLMLQGVLQCGYWFVQRQFLWVVPLFALFLGSVWEALLLTFSQLILILSRKKRSRC